MMNNKKQTRWLIICVGAGLLFSAEAYNFFSRSEVIKGVIFGVLAVVFYLLAYAYSKSKLK